MGGKKYFDQVAEQWDEMRKDFFSDRIRHTALKTANIQPGKLAADIGAGTGFITEALMENDVNVIAVDQSELMLSALKRKFKNLDCRIGDAERLPVEDGRVDYVFANMYLHHVETPVIAIKEMVRILKAGGILVITDLDEHHFEFLKTEHHDRWMGFKREDINGWFSEAGLKDITVDFLGENCCASSKCGCRDAVIEVFMATGFKEPRKNVSKSDKQAG